LTVRFAVKGLTLIRAANNSRCCCVGGVRCTSLSERKRCAALPVHVSRSVRARATRLRAFQTTTHTSRCHRRRLRPHRRLHTGFTAATPEGIDVYWAALIRMHDNALMAPLLQRHVQRAQHELGIEMVRHRPTTDTPADTSSATAR